VKHEIEVAPIPSTPVAICNSQGVLRSTPPYVAGEHGVTYEPRGGPNVVSIDRHAYHPLTPERAAALLNAAWVAGHRVGQADRINVYRFARKPR